MVHPATLSMREEEGRHIGTVRMTFPVDPLRATAAMEELEPFPVHDALQREVAGEADRKVTGLQQAIICMFWPLSLFLGSMIATVVILSPTPSSSSSIPTCFLSAASILSAIIFVTFL